MKNYLNETGTRYLFLLLDSCHLTRFLCETGFFL